MPRRGKGKNEERQREKKREGERKRGKRNIADNLKVKGEEHLE